MPITTPIFPAASAHLQLENLLRKTFQGIQLTKTDHDKAVEHYGAVTKWLAADRWINQFNPHLFHQGSMLLGTTIKPVGKAEYDLDVVCKLDILHTSATPANVFDIIWNRLYANKMYRPKLEAMTRCIRIKYEHEFHLDVVPAVPDCTRGGNFILIPEIHDGDMHNWKGTNPLDYADWFEGQKYVINKMAEARIDPMSAYEPVHAKEPLQLAIQLWKRWRDLHFVGKLKKHLPPSIILTTLSARYYRGEGHAGVALANILGNVVSLIRNGRPKLMNPIHPGEVISEKWENDYTSFDAFRTEVRAFHDRWLDLIHSRGMPTIVAELKALFGEEVETAYRASVGYVTKARADKDLVAERSTGNLYIASGAGYSTVQRNTHHGN